MYLHETELQMNLLYIFFKETGGLCTFILGMTPRVLLLHFYDSKYTMKVNFSPNNCTLFELKIRIPRSYLTQLLSSTRLSCHGNSSKCPKIIFLAAIGAYYVQIIITT